MKTVGFTEKDIKAKKPADEKPKARKKKPPEVPETSGTPAEEEQSNDSRAVS